MKQETSEIINKALQDDETVDMNADNRAAILTIMDNFAKLDENGFREAINILNYFLWNFNSRASLKMEIANLKERITDMEQEDYE